MSDKVEFSFPLEISLALNVMHSAVYVNRWTRSDPGMFCSRVIYSWIIHLLIIPPFSTSVCGHVLNRGTWNLVNLGLKSAQLILFLKFHRLVSRSIKGHTNPSKDIPPFSTAEWCKLNFVNLWSNSLYLTFRRLVSICSQEIFMNCAAYERGKRNYLMKNKTGNLLKANNCRSLKQD